jgi:hypothetical protein
MQSRHIPEFILRSHVVYVLRRVLKIYCDFDYLIIL